MLSKLPSLVITMLVMISLVAFVGFCIWFGPFLLVLAWNVLSPVFGLPLLNWIQGFCIMVVLSIIGYALNGNRGGSK